MDAGSLALLIPIVAIVGGISVKIARIFAQTRGAPTDPGLPGRLTALEEEVGSLRHELTEAQERLDFTERLLSQQRSDRLDAGK
jgi:hypothetical protein